LLQASVCVNGVQALLGEPIRLGIGIFFFSFWEGHYMLSSSRRNRKGSAFTLIELLVVIAIIAILAAILFPVFAQARQSARGAASMSNLKQISLGILMYVQDYDETMPLDQRWGDPASPLIWNPGAALWSSWAYDISPYIKNRQIFIDPLFGPKSVADIFYPVYSQYGYNHIALSHTNGGATPWTFISTSLAGVARPADCVLVGGHMDVDEVGGFWWYGANTMLLQTHLDPPDCNHPPGLCTSDWIADGFYASNIATELAGKYTAGVSLRKALNANLAHVDGHVKFMQAGQAAQGTNWNKTKTGSGSIIVTTPTVYKWAASP